MLCLEEAQAGPDGGAPTHPRLSRQEMQFVQVGGGWEASWGPPCALKGLC